MGRAPRCRESHSQTRSLSLLAPALLVLLTAVLPTRPRAQAPAAAPVYTFHVYEDLVQLPTLVLSSADISYPNLKATDFTVSLDGGPLFHPRHVRLEGDDPISLTLLLDLSSKDSANIAKHISSAVASIPGEWLTPRDRISIFALNCSLVRSTFDVPFTMQALDTGLHDALTSPLLQQRPTQGHGCLAARLWDALAGVVKQISQVPGRRVLMLVTDGADHYSSNSWKNLQIYSGNFNVTLIGVQPIEPLLLLSAHLSGMEARKETEDIFQFLCFGTGGTTLAVDKGNLPSQLARAINLLRQRYILEFPRPLNGTAGLHVIDVHVPNGQAIVRPAGITFPAPDEALKTSPTTLPSDPSRAPVLGDRKILSQPH